MEYRIEVQMNDFGEDSDWFDAYESYDSLDRAKEVARRWKDGCFTSRSPHAVRIVDNVKHMVFETYV